MTLEPAREVLPGLWVGKHSGRALEQLRREHPSILLIDQRHLGSSHQPRRQPERGQSSHSRHR
ncbi:hypothetical protein [Pseudomonas saliphila]|uniref:hypothetical protein n=1 Tax=Pseudomonas saliphila TaxID=2586906 RepID=UPI001238FCFD|nr:hypothetical protein [Pseudomonas saliphila]